MLCAILHSVPCVVCPLSTAKGNIVRSYNQHDRRENLGNADESDDARTFEKSRIEDVCGKRRMTQGRLKVSYLPPAPGLAGKSQKVDVLLASTLLDVANRQLKRSKIPKYGNS